MTATLEATPAAAPPNPPAPSPVAVAPRQTDFTRAWLAHGVSSFGDHFTLVALPLAAYARTGSALAVGVVAAMEAVTVLLLGLVAGALGDRVRRRPLLVATDLTRGVVLLALAVGVMSDDHPVVLLYVAAFALGALRVAHDAAEAALVPILVEEQRILRANSRLHASDSAAIAAGPVMAGALVALGGASLAFLADAVTFAVSGMALRSIRRIDDHDRPTGDAAERWAISDDIRAGWKALVRERIVVQALLVLAALNVVAIAAEAQFIPYAQDVIGMSAVALGLNFALGGATAVVTALVVGRRSVVRGDVLLLGLAVFSAGFLVAGIAPSRGTAALAHVCAGFGSALATTHWYSLRHKRFPLYLIGRVTIVTRMAVMALVPVAYVLGGWVASHAGPEVLFVAVASIGLLATAWGTFVGLGRLRVD